MKHYHFLSVFFLIFTSFCFSQDILLESFGPSFSEPVELRHAGDDRLFVVEKAGIIKVLNSDGSVNTVPFLDISSIVYSASSEGGLLGLAFHPDYPTNPSFFVNYTNSVEDTVIAKYTVSSDPDIANTSGTTLLIIEQPSSNHNGGSITFGADGYLYIGTGDGGSTGDPGDRAQNLNVLLGKMLRIDIDNGTPYSIPADNPYLNDGDDTTLSEIWAYGLRNPWKFSFDTVTNSLWIADVGQGDYEEINRVGTTDSGINYGWRCYEGNAPYNLTNCAPASTMTFPVAEYSHSFGCSITGGYVYRGTEEPGLQGKYFFADYCSTAIGILSENNGSWTYSFTDPFSGNNWSSFGVDYLNELYIVSKGGNIFKIVEDNLSVDGFENQFIKVFPNPSNDKIYFEFPNQDISSFIIKIYSIQGKLIKEINNIESEIFEISTQNIQNGFYLVEIINATGSKQLKKVIIN